MLTHLFSFLSNCGLALRETLRSPMPLDRQVNHTIVELEAQENPEEERKRVANRKSIFDFLDPRPTDDQ